MAALIPEEVLPRYPRRWLTRTHPTGSGKEAARYRQLLTEANGRLNRSLWRGIVVAVVVSLVLAEVIDGRFAFGIAVTGFAVWSWARRSIAKTNALQGAILGDVPGITTPFNRKGL